MEGAKAGVSVTATTIAHRASLISFPRVAFEVAKFNFCNFTFKSSHDCFEQDHTLQSYRKYQSKPIYISCAFIFIGSWTQAPFHRVQSAQQYGVVKYRLCR